MTKSVDEVARLFSVSVERAGNAGVEVYPGWPGWVIEGGRMRTMAWGFPLSLKGKAGQPLKPKPVNNTRADKLDSSFWNSSFEHRRCLIPMSAFAEAEGPKGAKTRTWFSVSGQSAFACAGIWRASAEWGPVYSMVMTDGSEAMAHVHDRMPVILDQPACAEWLSAAPDNALALCKPFAGELTIERTAQPWVGGELFCSRPAF